MTTRKLKISWEAFGPVLGAFVLGICFMAGAIALLAQKLKFWPWSMAAALYGVWCFYFAIKLKSFGIYKLPKDKDS